MLPLSLRACLINYRNYRRQVKALNSALENADSEPYNISRQGALFWDISGELRTGAPGKVVVTSRVSGYVSS